VESAILAQRSTQQDLVDADYRLFTEERYLHRMLVKEHWVIGPEPRPYPAL